MTVPSDALWSPVPVATGLPPAEAGPRPKADPMPDGPRTYAQLLRGGRRRWWKPLLTLLLVGAAAVLLLSLLSLVVPLLGGLALGVPDLGGYVERAGGEGDYSAVGFLTINLALAALIPSVGLSVWAVHRIRPRYVSSVVGGLRWRWLLRCTLVIAPLWVGYLLLGVVLDPPPPGRPTEWVALLVVTVLTTPLQAAGEEYFFRGFVMQNFGAWFARPLVALIVPGVVSAALFAAAHGSPDPWVIADLAMFAAVATLMGWRTGGLEAGIALHALNNTLLFGVVIGFGGFEESFVGGDTTSTPGAFATSAAFLLAALGLVWWQARKTRVQQHYLPRPRTAASPRAGFVAVSGPAA